LNEKVIIFIYKSAGNTPFRLKKVRILKSSVHKETLYENPMKINIKILAEVTATLIPSIFKSTRMNKCENKKVG
jgi:archaellin